MSILDALVYFLDFLSEVSELSHSFLQLRDLLQGLPSPGIDLSPRYLPCPGLQFPRSNYPIINQLRYKGLAPLTGFWMTLKIVPMSELHMSLTEVFVMTVTQQKHFLLSSASFIP